jgi:hypothetical protein
MDDSYSEQVPNAWQQGALVKGQECSPRGGKGIIGAFSGVIGAVVSFMVSWLLQRWFRTTSPLAARNIDRAQ